MNPIRIPIGKMKKEEFVESISRFFPHVQPIIAERMYDETKQYYINIIYDLNTGEILQAQGGNGWVLHSSYLKNVPTPENFDTLESDLNPNALFNNYSTIDERKKKKETEKVKLYDINYIVDRIAELDGEVSKLNQSEKKWLDDFNSDSNSNSDNI